MTLADFVLLSQNLSNVEKKVAVIPKTGIQPRLKTFLFVRVAQVNPGPPFISMYSRWSRSIFQNATTVQVRCGEFDFLDSVIDGVGGRIHVRSRTPNRVTRRKNECTGDQRDCRDFFKHWKLLR